MLYANEEVPESYMNHMIPELLKLVSKNNQLLTVSVENIFKFPTFRNKRYIYINSMLIAEITDGFTGKYLYNIYKTNILNLYVSLKTGLALSPEGNLVFLNNGGMLVGKLNSFSVKDAVEVILFLDGNHTITINISDDLPILLQFLTLALVV